MKLNKVAEEIRELIDQRQKELGLTFEEENHIYMMNGKTDYPSVSKVLKKFYTEFPVEVASYNKAKGDPQKQQELIEEWAAAGLYSTNMGSRVHYELEKELIARNGHYKEVRQPIFECDINGNCTWVNEKYCQLTKHNISHFIGNGWKSMIHEDDRERVIQEWESAVEDKRSSTCTYRIVDADGNIYHISVISTINDIYGYIGTITILNKESD